jgi:hypothetical protein
MDKKEASEVNEALVSGAMLVPLDRDDGSQIEVNVQYTLHPGASATSMEPSEPDFMEITSVKDLEGNEVEISRSEEGQLEKQALNDVASSYDPDGMQDEDDVDAVPELDYYGEAQSIVDKLLE